MTNSGSENDNESMTFLQIWMQAKKMMMFLVRLAT